MWERDGRKDAMSASVFENEANDIAIQVRERESCRLTFERGW